MMVLVVSTDEVLRRGLVTLLFPLLIISSSSSLVSPVFPLSSFSLYQSSSDSIYGYQNNIQQITI
jgi:hypothetical protein